MLLWLLDWLTADATGPWSAGQDWLASPAWSESLGKITVRAALAACLAFLTTLLSGGPAIAWLSRHCREPNRSPSAAIRDLHRPKHDTPSMGGLFVLGAWFVTTLALADLASAYVQLGLVVALALAALGAVDDLVKLRTGRQGLSARSKVAVQALLGLGVAAAVYMLQSPASGDATGAGSAWWFIPWGALVLVASSNAVNLTDGLDGLAGGCHISATAAIAAAAYAAGHAGWADYLGIAHVRGAGELLVPLAALVGAVLGFLWFNCHPAQVFMGDTGSLPLGGLLGFAAIASRQELLLVVVGGVFVVEAASVILQVGWFRWSGRRLFRCAPVHHHFQLVGWPESKIVVRFWIASAVCAVIGMAVLKLHGLPS